MPHRSPPPKSALSNPLGRDYSPFDRTLMALQRGLNRATRTDEQEPRRSVPGEGYPATDVPESPLDENARRHAAGLMRVNHAGEVSAQALYHGQALMARDAAVRSHLLHAAAEERQHLKWCEQRLGELRESPSRLSPLWYAGSFAMGAAAGLAGDRWNLGFVEETEKQVAAHLEDHLKRLPESDDRSRAIVSAMKEDEKRHGEEAAAAGARALPGPVRQLMGLVAGVMKFGAYRI